MNGRGAFRLLAAVALVLTVLPTGVVGQNKSLKDQLVGTWTLVSWDQTLPDGSKVDSFGPNPKGINIFDANGHFILMIARSDLPKIASSDRTKATPEEAKAILGGSIAYFGTYTVNEAEKTAVLRLDSTTFPNQLGTEQKRVIKSITADEMTYNNPVATSGGQILLSWKRAK